jgi:exodeoxyribonuclease V alpha subunit
MAMRAFNSKPEAQQKALSASAPNKQKDAGDESRNAMIRMSPQPDAGEVLAGLVERVTYHNAENGFCVLRARARGHRDVVTVVGHAAAISAGEWIMASGQWINDRTHGQQFRARFLRTSAPTSAEGIERYLSSGMIRGVGPVYAKKLVRAFGEKVFDIIESGPDRLREVDGIGPVRAASILAAWAEQKAVREIMVFLHSHGVSTARAVRIFKTYGADAIQVMTDNPYRLARDIRGIGFKTADAIAMKLGVAKTAMVRVRAGISYALTEAMDEGHCGLPTNELVPLAEKLLEVPQQLIRTALELELQEATVIADQVGETPCVFLAGLYRAERTIAHRLIRLANGMLPWPWIDSDKAVLWVEKHVGLVLAGSQVAAIRLALRSKVLVMTGGPGVGKTTIIKAILRIVAAKATSLLLCAPTGRAAKRLTEATGFEAKTIHRLLEVDPKGGGFRRREDNPLDCDLLVIDEASMVDVMLMQALVNAVPEGRFADRRRHRPASLGRAGPSSGGHYLIRRCAGGTAH